MAFPLRPRNLTENEIKIRVREIAQMLHIEDLLEDIDQALNAAKK